MTIETRLTCAALVGVLLLAGCGKEESAQPPHDPYDTPYARMHDPEYLKALDGQRDEQKSIMREMAAARKEIAAFCKAHPGEEVPAELQRKLNEAADRMEQNRKASQQLVKERILRENAAADERRRQNDLKKGE